jgi:GntR family transcriptional regulator
MRDLLRVTLADTPADSAENRVAGEAELMGEFSAPRDAVREALGLLADEGLILRRRGAGTFCSDESFSINVQVPAVGEPLSRQFGERDRLTVRLLEWTWAPATTAVANRLDEVEAGDECLCVDYLLLRNDRPACVITNYLRRAEAAALSPTQFVDDFYELLSHTGRQIRSQDLLLQPRLADPEVAALLDVEVGAPVMWMEQVIRDAAGRAIDFAVVHLHGELRVGIPDIPRMSPRNLQSLRTVNP